MPPKSSTLDADFSAILATSPVEGNTTDLLPQHFTALASALRVSLENDIALYALAWKLKCKQPLKITRQEWCDGLASMRCTTVGAAAAAMESLRAEVVPDENFRSFYDFVFEWVRDNSSQRFLAIDTVLALWPLMFKDRKFPHLQRFIEFVQARNTKTIPRDVWKQMYHFQRADLNNWDENGSWPSLMDDFVHAQKKA